MNTYPFLSEEVLTKNLLSLRDSYAKESCFFLAWMDQSSQDLMAEKKFVVCGSVCRSEIKVLARNANVIAIVDDFLSKTQKEIFGIPVIDADAWVELSRGDRSIVSCLLLPGPRAYQYFIKLAVQWDVRIILPLQFLHILNACNVDKKNEPGRFFFYGSEFFHRTYENLDALLSIKNIFEDRYSKITWLHMLSYRMTLNPYYLEACSVGHLGEKFNLNSYSTNRQFFNFTESEVYVDGGAFNGDTLEGFLQAVSGKFKHIHAFEPSLENNKEIRNRLRRLQDEYIKPLSSSITLHEQGLWDSSGILEFNQNFGVDDFGDKSPVYALAAHMVDSGFVGHIYDAVLEKKASIQVPVVSIDGATDQSATFIKLEIEGSELKALHGAVKTIEKNKPKMAISVYHKPEDYETLTDFVLKTGQNYKLGFRQHNPFCPDATVLYCY
ncbi:FkbM family methyltransferase [Rhodoferax sp.]|uniref:FkbM family methyltransferase n=1 Tax=Rhodoferax sp. TaxID=50421 RepID=UPI0025E7DFD4|nr:FkbM family methyltransferase [Rhodoferax sp.]